MINIISFSDFRGGAAKAANKFYDAIRDTGLKVRFVVVEKHSNTAGVFGPTPVQFYKHFAKRLLAHLLLKLQWSNNPSKHSLNLFSCPYVLNQIDGASLVHLNWINNETISTAALGKISTNLLITMHDEWLFSGAEHNSLDNVRVVDGYLKSNKNVKGLDWDRRVWEAKKLNLNAVKDRVVITGPSQWIVDRAQSSKMLKGFDVRLLPNAINTDVFKPYGILDVKYDFLKHKKVILFGAVNGKNMALKGFGLLNEAIRILGIQEPNLNSEICLVSFGGKLPHIGQMHGFEHVEVGRISSEKELAGLYSLAQFTVVPSMVESFGQVAAESLACETPVVCFNYSGLTDIVKHDQSGYLAEPFFSESLAEAMLRMLSQPQEMLTQLGVNGRTHVVNSFSKPVITEALKNLYYELENDNVKQGNGNQV